MPNLRAPLPLLFAIAAISSSLAATAQITRLPEPPVLKHSGLSAVSHCAFNLDSTRVATTGTDETVRIWTMPDMAPLHIMRGHRQGTNCSAFSQDDRWLASLDWGGEARVWDAKTGELRGAFRPSMHPDLAGEDLEGCGFPSMTFSPDGDLVLFYLDRAQGYWLIAWDWQANAVVLQAPVSYPPELNRWSFGGEGGAVLAGGEGGAVLAYQGNEMGQINFFNTRSRTPAGATSVLSPPDRTEFFQIQFQPGGQHLLCLDDDYYNVSTIDMTTREVIDQQFFGDEYSGPFVELDGSSFVDEAIVEAVSGGHSSFYALQASNNKQELILNHRLEVEWVNLKTGAHLGFSTRDSLNPVTSFSLHPDGRRLSTTDNRGILKIWDAESGKELFSHYNPQVKRADFTADGKFFVLTMKGESALVWDAQTFQVLQPLVFAGSPVSNIIDLELIPSLNRAILHGFAPVKDAPDERSLAVVLWDAANHRTVTILSDPGSGTRLTETSDDGRRVAVCSRKGLCDIRDTESGELIQQLDLADKGLTTAKFSPNNKHLITAGTDGVRISEIESGRELFHLQDGASVLELELDWEHDQLITLNSESVLDFWSLTDGTHLKSMAQLDELGWCEWVRP